MDEIVIVDGRADLRISGDYGPEDLRRLLRRLCEAHGELLPHCRGPGDEPTPAFCWTAGRVIAGDGPLGTKVFFDTPTFGWVGVDLPVRATIELVARLSTALLATPAMAAADQPTESGAGAAPMHVSH